MEKTDEQLIYDDLSKDFNNWIEVQCNILSETNKAICFDLTTSDFGKKKFAWFPKSQMIILDLGNEAGIRYFVKTWIWNKNN